MIREVCGYLGTSKLKTTINIQLSFDTYNKGFNQEKPEKNAEPEPLNCYRSSKYRKTIWD